MLRAVRFVQAAAKGSSKPSLIEANDGKRYWTKFQGNPQGDRTLVNEWMASKLAISVGLPVMKPELIQVSQSFIDKNPGTWFDHKSHYGVQKPFAGIQFATPHVEGTETPTPEVQDATAALFAGGLVFDVWTMQEDRKQAIFYEQSGSHQVAFIDFGRAFCPDHLEMPLEFIDGGRAPFCREFDYSSFTDFEVFEPWLTRIEQLPTQTIAEAAAGLPRVWFDAKSVWDLYECEQGDTESYDPNMEGRIAWLASRARSIRSLLEAEIGSSPDFIPHWTPPLSDQALEEMQRREELAMACCEDDI
jgi:hypothetical protein